MTEVMVNECDDVFAGRMDQIASVRMALQYVSLLGEKVHALRRERAWWERPSVGP